LKGILSFDVDDCQPPQSFREMFWTAKKKLKIKAQFSFFYCTTTHELRAKGVMK